MNFVIVGAGIQGIYAALRLRKKYPFASINLIDSANSIGGLYNSIQDPIAGTLDKGMHIVYETLNDEIDSTIDSALPQKEWLYLEGNRKDIAGVFHKGNLETQTPYINLTHLDEEVLTKSLGEIMQTFAHPVKPAIEYSSAFEYFKHRFGKTIASEVINPIINKLWKTTSLDMHPASTKLVLMDRICLFQEETVKNLMKSPRFKEILGYPNQLNLDLANRTSQKGRYPKKYGLSNLIAGFRKLLIENDINVHLNSFVESINFQDNVIKSITVRNKSGAKITLEAIKSVVWSAAIKALGSSLGLDLVNKNQLDPGLIQKYIYLLLDVNPSMNNIYYYYSLDPGTSTFRVTNYASYCPSAIKNIPELSDKKLYPICIEMHYSNDSCNIYDEAILRKAISELIATGAIKSESNIKFSRVVNIPSGFPLLTTNNCTLLSKDRAIIQELNLSNLILSGQIPEKGVFFLNETLLSLYDSLESIN